MSTRSSKRSQSSTSGRTSSVSGRNQPQSSGRTSSVSGRNQPQSSGRRAAAAAAPAAVRPSGRVSGRSAAPSAALAPDRAPSGRGSRASGRQSRRAPDVSNEFKSQRQAAAAKNKSFGTIFAIGFVVFMILAALGSYVWYINTAGLIEDDQRRKQAFSEWVTTNQNTFKNKAAGYATALKPIFEDLPEEKSTPELETKLVAKYGPTLSSSGAKYAWCKKTWTIKDKTYSLNVSATNAKEFAMTPTNAAPLGEPINIAQINGELSQTGNLTLFWDLDQKCTVAVLVLNLAPPPPTQAAGGPQVKAIPPTSFYLWYEPAPLTGDAKAHLDKKLAAAAAAAAPKK